MIDMISLASKSSNSILTDVFEDQEPKTLVFQRVQNLGLADVSA